MGREYDTALCIIEKVGLDQVWTLDGFIHSFIHSTSSTCKARHTITYMPVHTYDVLILQKDLNPMNDAMKEWRKEGMDQSSELQLQLQLHYLYVLLLCMAWHGASMAW